MTRPQPVPQPVADGVWRLPLPSQTLPPFDHTNTYLIAESGVGVIVDPGFHEEESWNALQAGLSAAGVTLLKAVLLTHTHPDHCAGLKMVKATYPDIPIYVHPNELPRLEQNAQVLNLRALNPGRTLTVGNKTVTSVFTPGHSPGHLSYYLEPETLALIGDIAASHGSTWVGLPEGDVEDYLSSLDTLRSLKLSAAAPGHGELIRDPYGKLSEMRRHRLARLEQVYQALGPEALSLSELRRVIYPDVPESAAGLTEASLLALLKKLMNDMRVLHLGDDESGPYRVRR